MIEQRKYTEVWEHPEYRISAPGESFVSEFVRLTRPTHSDTIVDFGCGTGRAALKLSDYAPVLALDFAENCLDKAVAAALCERLKFQQHDLTQPLELSGTYGFCTDVMEHIPTEDVDTVLRNICTAALKVYFNISTVPDHMGALIGEPLHLTVKPFDWWEAKFREIGFRIDYSKEYPEGAVFYGSVYANGNDVSDMTGLNISEDRVRSNILANLSLGFQEVCPHEVQDETVYILAGGASLGAHEAEIVALGKEGKKFITVNGTYKWLIDRGIRPAAHFMVDGRTFNERFIHTIIDTCKYIFSSQVAHEVAAKVPKAQGWLYHSGDSDFVKEVFEHHCKEIGVDKSWYPVMGGTTVINRALVVLAMLGFRKIEIFGWDSCVIDGQHHAYEQKENDEKRTIEVMVGGRRFQCHPWMVVQANEVPKLIRYILGLIDGFEINVRGDGLIAHMLQYAAQIEKGEANGC